MAALNFQLILMNMGDFASIVEQLANRKKSNKLSGSVPVMFTTTNKSQREQAGEKTREQIIMEQSSAHLAVFLAKQSNQRKLCFSPVLMSLSLTLVSLTFLI